MQNREIRALTGLRGVAALWVVIYHEADKNGVGLSFNLLRHGYNAVDVFFILSGFVMALTYGRDFVHMPSLQTYGAFLGKRIARVYPLYVIATIVTFGIFSLHLSHNELSNAPYLQLLCNLLGIQAWGLFDSIVGPAWSISTEWAAYLLFPLLAYLALGASAARAGSLCVASWAALVFIAYAPDRIMALHDIRSGPLDIFAYDSLAPLVRCLAIFSLGLLTFRWRAFVSAKYGAALAAASIAVLLVQGSDLALIIICALLVPALSYDEGFVARCLGSRPVFALGVWSYAIYLLHARFNPVRLGFKSLFTHLHLPFAGNLAIIFTVGVLIICSAVTYRVIEKPLRGVLRHWFSLNRGRAVSQEPAAP